MRKDIYYNSCGAGKIHACRWMPEGEPKAVVQIVHGIAEHILRYDDFANYLNSLGYLVVAEDHMGHGGSIGDEGIQGYFHGGWFAAVEDTYRLLTDTKKEYPALPYVLFGHSMGSFMTRTILQEHPDSGIDACILSGTGWMPEALLNVGSAVCKAVCRVGDETKPNEKLQGIVFGGYNKKVEHPRTPYDWLSRDKKAVDAYMEDPLCGFTASAGLLRDMLSGILYIQKRENLCRMDKTLPVRFISGGDDPVGSYGEGIKKAETAFNEAGMEQVSEKIYPLCRHELLNELNKREVYEDTARWLAAIIGKNAVKIH